jgi:sulfite reductase (NADPH) hemoprotein beta-component
VERVKLAYTRERIDEETFFSWSRRQEPDYFKALLADLVSVKPEDLAEVLRDHGDAADFRVLQLGGGECAGASQERIGTLFFEAAHERNYREALKFQRKYADAVSCAEASLRAVAKALSSAAGIAESEDLTATSIALASGLPGSERLAGELARLADAVAPSEEELTEAAAARLFARVDAWVAEAADLCQKRDPTLVLRDALPWVVTTAPARIPAIA